MFDEEKGLYTIGTVSQILGEHPETLRVWERNGLVKPDRQGYQRKYTDSDLKRLRFIQYFMDEKGLNIAGMKQLVAMYSCWFRQNCKGGAVKNSRMPVNESKPCWKENGTFCVAPIDKSDICASCEMLKNCIHCKDCG